MSKKEVKLDLKGSLGEVKLRFGLSEMEQLSLDHEIHDLQSLATNLAMKKGISGILLLALRQNHKDLDKEDLESVDVDMESLQEALILAYLIADFGPKKAQELMKSIKDQGEKKK